MSAGFGVRLRRYWVAGILVLAPTALTLWVVWKLFTFFDDILGGAAARARHLGRRARVRAAERAAAAARLRRGELLRQAGLRALGPAHAPGPADQQDLRDAAPDRGAAARPVARRLLRQGRDRGVPVAGNLGPRLRDVDGGRGGGREDGPEGLQPLHPERRQPDDGVPARRAGGEGHLPRHDAGAGDEDDRLGRRARAAGAPRAPAFRAVSSSCSLASIAGRIIQRKRSSSPRACSSPPRWRRVSMRVESQTNG